MVQYRLRLSPLEMEKMDYFRIERLLENWEKQVKKEKEERDREEREQERQAKAQKQQMPKMPNYGGFKIPKY